jgi:hypothetical protein
MCVLINPFLLFSLGRIRRFGNEINMSKWPSHKALIDLSIKLGLDIHGDEPEWELQEWEWDFADSDRIEEFIEIYNLGICTDDQKVALMSLIVESYNDYIFKYGNHSEIWKTISKELLKNHETHQYTINEWLISDAQSEVGNLVRELFKEYPKDEHSFLIIKK